MKTPAVALIAVLPCLIAGHVRADDVACRVGAAGQGIPIDKAIEKAEAMGYAVRKAKRSKGCWEVEGFDRNGASIEMRIDPLSGEVVKPANWRGSGSSG